ncbi:MAG: DNA photolyase family protein [Alphaproteobacteria bacterium]|nr:DNA photolyase family protein [Alphaproteobacteria bacterium]
MSLNEQRPTIVWFRQDLRLGDNPALKAALDENRPIILLYIYDENFASPWSIQGASLWWLGQSLLFLERKIKYFKNKLILKRGSVLNLIPHIIRETRAISLHWNRCYEPSSINRDTLLKEKLQKQGIEVTSHNALLLSEPWHNLNQSKQPFKVFTPFWNRLRNNLNISYTYWYPKHLPCPDKFPESDNLKEWKLDPFWSKKFKSYWQPGEDHAEKQLDDFIQKKIFNYSKKRDYPYDACTSRMSPYLHWGEISPARIWSKTIQQSFYKDASTEQIESFLRQLGWREFCHSLLFYWPTFPAQAWQDKFNNFPWNDKEEHFNAWCCGRTGYPFIDAAMQELWQTGWMHNRARMVVASFLIKDLLIPWQKGEAWFWDTLVDADLAQNSSNWQWVAGSGADASPYFRIFNPILQSKKFDPQGNYIRQWLPILKNLSDNDIHTPWKLSKEKLKDCGLVLGKNYPYPIVDHEVARKKALNAYKALV